ncbi:MAG: hypothetical protein GWO26_12005 [Phycisphaerae bacterium]|nr:hypothetical protein [Phycisphaerae bacterium]
MSARPEAGMLLLDTMRYMEPEVQQIILQWVISLVIPPRAEQAMYF